MGYYVEVPQDFNKVVQLCQLHAGVQIKKPDTLAEIPEDKALIVVVHNAMFEAAALAFDQGEFEAFHLPYEQRHREYVLLDKALAYKLTKYTPR